MKKNYLLLIIIFGLLTLALYSTYSSYPWIGRGARQTNAESAGIFAYNNYNGSAAVAYSSRVVLAVY